MNLARVAINQQLPITSQINFSAHIIKQYLKVELFSIEETALDKNLPKGGDRCWVHANVTPMAHNAAVVATAPAGGAASQEVLNWLLRRDRPCPKWYNRRGVDRGDSRCHQRHERASHAPDGSGARLLRGLIRLGLRYAQNST